ncbi:MAG: putative signal transducing protein [Solirubrobacteraceae bacterium]
MPPAGGGSTGRASDNHERALKVRPELTQGDLVSVARAANQAEAELIQGLLLNNGVPSMLRRSAGFDVPDFLAAGPRDVLVPAAAVASARELLNPERRTTWTPGTSAADTDRPPAPIVRPGWLLAGLLAALAIGLLIVWLGLSVS